jgi:hypothetical protein
MDAANKRKEMAPTLSSALAREMPLVGLLTVSHL